MNRGARGDPQRRSVVQILAVLIGLLPGLMPVVASAHGTVARSTYVQLGLSSVLVEFSANTLHAGQGSTIMLHAKPGTFDGLTAVLRPDVGVDATPVRVPMSLSPAGDTATLTVSAPVLGPWRLVLNSSEGNASIPLQVAAGQAIPVWLGWVMGLSPLLGLAAFAVYQTWRVSRIRARADSASFAN